MGGQKSKGLTYILVFIGLLLGGALTLITVLMLSPNKSIGGYTFVSEKYNYSVVRTLGNAAFQDVHIDAGFYRVVVSEREEITGPNDPSFNLFLKSNLMGVAKESSYETKVNLEIKDGDLFFSFTSLPNGLLFNHSSCELYLVIFTHSTDWHTKTIHITTTTGDVVLGGPDVGEVATLPVMVQNANVTTERGNITLTEKFQTRLNQGELNLKTSDGTIRFQEDLKVTTLNIENATGNVFATDGKTIEADITTKGKNPEFGFYNIIGDVSIETESGLWRANQIDGNVNGTETIAMTDIFIQEVLGYFHIENAKNFTLVLNSVSELVSIRSESGYIKVTNAAKAIDIMVDNATVILNNVTNQVDVTTKTGSIELNYQKGIADCEAATIVTERGTITIRDAVGNINATATGSGSISASFVKINNQSALRTNSGSLKTWISIAAQNQFILETQSGKSVKVDLGAVQSTEKNLKTHSVNGGILETNKITVISATGAVEVGAYTPAA